MASLTPLESAPAFNETIRACLADYWITTVEEFVSTARASNHLYGSGIAALARALDLSEVAIRELVQVGRALLPPDVAFDIGAELDVGTGAIFEGMAEPDASAFDLPVEALPPEMNLSTSLPAVRNQGKRNTCVAFTLAAMVQQVTGDNEDLSPQFLYWSFKERDGIPGDVGTRPDIAMQALTEVGACFESTWRYVPVPNHQDPGQGPPPAAALKEAQSRRALGCLALSNHNVNRIKAVIAAGTSVLLVLPVSEHWTTTWQARALGRVRKPLPGEGLGGGHSMLAIGYRDDTSVPGGGYFIVRNSWGTGWGTENVDGAGYAHIPYRVVYESNKAALTITGIAPPGYVATSTEAVASQIEQAAESLPALAGAADAQVLYQEVLQLSAVLTGATTRLDMLLRQFGELLGQSAISVADRANQESMAAPSQRRQVLPNTGPLIMTHALNSTADSPFAPNGILATTGEPLLRIDAQAANLIARAGTPRKKTDDPEYTIHSSRVWYDTNTHLGTVRGRENDLLQSGWAIVVNADDDAYLLRELSPLIAKRCGDQGLPVPRLKFGTDETCGQWLERNVDNLDKPLRSKIPVLVYHTGESAAQFLARHGTSIGPVKPELGVPFYLLLVGRPGPLTADDTKYIPFSVQYELDIFWGVGRLCFTDPLTGSHRLSAYRDYAEQVVAFEQATAPPYGKHIVYFGTRHDLDRATERSADELVKPLYHGFPDLESPATKLDFTQQLFLAEQATRANLDSILRGGAGQGRPALLFTATHGIGFPADDPRLASQQGALVCQDWTGYGGIKREHWYAAEDLSMQTRVDGLIAVCFACYSVGCPEEDQFVFEPGQDRPIIAPYPLVAQLPQQLLARGALAILGHVDRAWSHSFSAPGVPAQTQSFESVVSRLMQGDRLGLATDQFNMVQGAVATRLADLLEKIQRRYQATATELSATWVARNDARNYAVLGDPAVRLPFAV